VIQEFSFPAIRMPGAIAAGPDGSLWFSESGEIDRITTTGVITKFTVPTPAYGIASGTDGALWLTGQSAIMRMTTSGVVTQYALLTPNSSAQGITSGPDGALWFTEFKTNKIGRITTEGVITEYSIPTTNSGPNAITTGPDGALWFTEQFVSKIGRISADGNIIEYSMSVGSNPTAIASGPDGALWFTQLFGNTIGRITTAGAIANFPAANSYSIALGPDGAMWFTEYFDDDGSIGRIDTDGSVVSYPVVPNAQLKPAPYGIALGSDGAMWFTESMSGAIGRILPSGSSGCSYAVSPRGQLFSAAGGIGAINIAAPPGCDWTITGFGPASGVTFANPTSGTGNATVNYQIVAGRGASLTVAGLPFTIEEESSSLLGLNFIGSMPHFAAQENWTTTFTLVKKGTDYPTARFSLFGDDGSPLPLTLILPLQVLSPALTGPLFGSTFDRQILGSLTITAAGSTSPSVQVGSAQLAATGAVDGFTIFHQIPTGQEAVVPLETRNAGSYRLAFDNTDGIVLGVAVQNASAQAAVIPVVVRDDTGAVISTPGATISVAGSGHKSFVLSDPLLGFPITANKRGTIEFDRPPSGQISVLGLRFTPPNNALTTVPALANAGTGGGSIAHIASGGDGWQTTFALVNTGTVATQATLSFFADSTGAPLPLPLSFPQSGGGTTMMASAITRTLAAGATLLVQSSGAPQLLTGSAQLNTDGNVSGFVIFRHNNQEAVVPLESRNAAAYILAFDNTNGTATGIAINSVSAQGVNIPVIVRDELGDQIATDTVPLAANGHLAFTLAVDKYPATANIRGTIEFDKPANGQIGAVGIRIPSSHTYTTLPALAN
jgi:virginiamycin B lyase